jgi:translation elongation factor EF-G
VHDLPTGGVARLLQLHRWWGDRQQVHAQHPERRDGEDGTRATDRITGEGHPCDRVTMARCIRWTATTSASRSPGLQAFREAFTQADPQLMEPVQELEMRVPTDLTGDVMTDLQGRSSVVIGVDTSGRYQIIRTLVPLAEMDRYSTTLRSLTQGRGTYSERFHAYQSVPPELQQRLISVHQELMEA